MYTVYVIKSLKDGKFYIGSTSNLSKRITYHNNGLNKSTRYRAPFTLVYKEELPTLHLVRKRELEIKRMKGGVQFKTLLNSQL